MIRVVEPVRPLQILQSGYEPILCLRSRTLKIHSVAIALHERLEEADAALGPTRWVVEGNYAMLVPVSEIGS